MAGNITIRTLVSKLVLQGFDQAVKGLKRYRDDWNITAKVVDAAASAVERSAARASAAMASMANGAAAVRQAAGSGGGGGGGPRAPRAPRTPSEAQEVARQARERERARREQEKQAARQRREEEAQARRDARENERAQLALERQAAQRGRAGGGGGRVGVDPIDAAVRRSNVVEARRAGLAQGAERVTEAASALGRFASASDKAKAKVADLTEQVARNRKSMADLREQAARTGDADGTLAAKMQGLSVATGKASVELASARRELRAVDGGLIDAVKSAGNLSGRFDAIRVAAGNLIAAGVSRGIGAITDGLVGSAKAAIDFESNMADVKKVLSEDDLANFDNLSEGVKRASREIGVMPNEVAALTASLAQSGIAGEELITTVEDASKLAVAFGISGEQAGQALAKLRTGLGLSRDEVNSLTGTINVLSNNLAATAPEITDAVQRVGSVGKAANLSGQTVAALATSMIASGANAEVAATGTKNFIRALGAGSAATKRQREAFSALGLSAEETAGYLVKGGEESEKAIRGVVERIGKLRAEDRLPVLIELFGSESIGAIGPLATNIDLLTRSFSLAGDAAEAAGSVEKEFASRSDTTDQAIKKLKASVSVLAIEFGDALLPYINDVVKFLTSPEGQEWGRGAVEKAVGAVTTLASGVKSLAEFFGFLLDKIGGTGLAVVGLGVAIAGLVGPLGLVAAAGVAMGAAIAEGIDRVLHSAERAQLGLLKLHNQAQAIRQQEQDAERAEQVAESDEASKQLDRERRVQRATDLWEQRQRAKPGVQRGSKEDLAITRKAAQMRETLLTGKGAGRVGTFEERIGSFESSLYDAPRNNEDGVVGIAQARANKAAEKKRGGHGHKATEMDKRLAALDPALAGVLRQGGEADAGGDLKVSNDPLSRAVYARATGTGGGGGSGGIGPGPNITNNIYNNNVTVTQNIDASSSSPVAENVARAAYDGAQQVGNVTFTGLQRVLALKTSGGRMV